jgi:hypothetical protein
MPSLCYTVVLSGRHVKVGLGKHVVLRIVPCCVRCFVTMGSSSTPCQVRMDRACSCISDSALRLSTLDKPPLWLDASAGLQALPRLLPRSRPPAQTAPSRPLRRHPAAQRRPPSATSKSTRTCAAFAPRGRSRRACARSRRSWRRTSACHGQRCQCTRARRSTQSMSRWRLGASSHATWAASASSSTAYSPRCSRRWALRSRCSRPACRGPAAVSAPPSSTSRCAWPQAAAAGSSMRALRGGAHRPRRARRAAA